METYAERDEKIKRTRSEMEKESKEVPDAKKIETVWEYLEGIKELQKLELQIETIQKKLKMKELRFPDLKNLRGNVNHLSEGDYWEVEVDEKKRIVPGKSYDDALEKYKKKLEQDKKNAEAQKKKQAKKE